MQILKEAGTDWCKRRLLSKLYVDQSVISMTEPKGDKCEDWKRSSTRMLFVTNSIQIIWQLSYQRRFERFGDFKIG
jgi:hypothetical protein